MFSASVYPRQLQSKVIGFGPKGKKERLNFKVGNVGSSTLWIL
jgi:hypothetical protein